MVHYHGLYAAKVGKEMWPWSLLSFLVDLSDRA